MNKSKVIDMINWDHVPKESVVSFNPNAGEILISGGVPLDRDWHEVKQPPKLVDGAWYACSDRNYKFIGQYCNQDNLISQGMEYRKPHELTIHNRIPDELWGNQ